MISPAIRNSVRKRAKNRCEYCLLHQDYSVFTHHVEHIIAKQHGGLDTQDNLALVCHRCNLRKGSNLTGIDSASGKVVSLFNPRHDSWSDHFVLKGIYIIGLTSVGNATIQVLAINDTLRLELRAELLRQGKY